MSEIKLYEDQNNLMRLIVDAIKEGHKQIVVSAPCGFGKTVVFSYISKGALKKNNRVWIIVDSIELIEQARDTLNEFGISSAVMQGQHEDTDHSKDVQVITAQTLTRRWDYFQHRPDWLPGIIIIDEAHIQHKAHQEAINYIKKIEERRDVPENKKVITLAFTATPTGKGMGLIYSKLIVAKTTKELVDAERLVPSIGFACYTPNMKGAKTSNGDYSEKDSEERVNTKKIRGDVVANYARLGENRQSIAFCVNIQHSIDLANEFALAGYNVAQLDGYTHKELRRQIIDDYRAGLVQIIFNVGVLVKGFDSEVDCVLDCAPTKSISRFIQRLGRGMRLSKKYDNLKILDFAGNMLRLGHPEDYNPANHGLCMGIKGEVKDHIDKDEPLPTKCPMCGALKKPKVIKCPNPDCGHITEKPAGIENEHGDLEKIKKKSAKKLNAAEKRNEELSREKKQEMFSAFMQIAKSSGHLSHLYHDFFGKWPKGFIKDQTLTTPKAIDTAKRFKTSRAIAYSRRRPA